MYIWRLKVDDVRTDYFSTFELVQQWIALYKPSKLENVDIILIEQIYVEE